MKNQSAIANGTPLAVSAMDEHAGFRQMFAPQKLTLGFILPLEAYTVHGCQTPINRPGKRL